MTSLLEWTSDIHELLIYFIELYRPECTVCGPRCKKWAKSISANSADASTRSHKGVRGFFPSSPSDHTYPTTQQHIKSEKFHLIIIAISEHNSVLHYYEHNVNALLHIYLYRFVSRSKLHILFLPILLLFSVSDQKYWILQFKKTVRDLGTLNLKCEKFIEKKTLFFIYFCGWRIKKIWRASCRERVCR